MDERSKIRLFIQSTVKFIDDNCLYYELVEYLSRDLEMKEENVESYIESLL